VPLSGSQSIINGGVSSLVPISNHNEQDPEGRNSGSQLGRRRACIREELVPHTSEQNTPSDVEGRKIGGKKESRERVDAGSFGSKGQHVMPQGVLDRVFQEGNQWLALGADSPNSFMVVRERKKNSGGYGTGLLHLTKKRREIGRP